tara:strand:+ start:430 stop:834 length:405 start_codon:yes stop_codon:yes gene_type:complete
MRLKLKKFILVALLSITTLIEANAMSGSEIKNFKFEDYKTEKAAKEALLEIHPIGSNFNGLITTLEQSGGKCEYMDEAKLKKAQKNNNKIKHLTNVVHCETFTGLIKGLAWRVSIMIANDKIDDIGVSKEYMGL